MTDKRNCTRDAGPSHQLSRRRFLQGALGGAAAIGLGSIAAGCGSGSGSAAPTTSGSTGKAKRGGSLNAGLSGGSSSDTLDAQAGVNYVDIARCWQLYDALYEFDDNARPRLALAEEVTPNKDATVWTIRVKSGITFHNGKPLGAEDVIYSLQRIMNPKDPLPGAASATAIDYHGMKKLDARTVSIRCHSPFSTFPQLLPTHYFTIVPVDYNPKQPIGTGPFKYKSFVAGQQSVFTRNENFWQSGLPYVDEVVISEYSDEVSQINALASGEADVIDLLSAESISAVRSQGGRVVISPGGGITPFTMRVDQPPFNDVRVRQAMRLLVDRPQMINLLFSGHATLGNDITSIWDPAYDHSIPQRAQDIAQAKHLLKKAGHENLSVQLVTSNIAAGTVRAAQIFAQQAKSAGVTVSLQQVTPTDLYGTNYLKWTFAQDFWTFYYYFPQVGLGMLPGSPYNETHFHDPRYIALYNKGLATVDDAARYEIAHEMQMIDYDDGGYIIPYFPGVIDAASSKVSGVVPTKTGIPLSNFGFKLFWFDS